MNAYATELVHLVLRWVHLIAGIMWIGNSMLFNWLDRNLVRREGADERHVGEIWMVHSGGFYQVEKLMLAPGQMPRTLHWFKWQNGVTWLSGISLMILLFYMGRAAMMIDASVYALSPVGAVALSVGSLIGAFALYDVIWRTPLARTDPALATAATVAIVVGCAVLYFNTLSGRAAYVHMGVLLGTMMTGNVWFCIMPSQRELIAATEQGRPQDPAIGYQAKQRSVHNNYFTFPLLFIMLSGHFPSTFGSKHNWEVLTVLALSSATIRHLMNIRFGRPTRDWLWGAIGVGITGLVVVYALIVPRTSARVTRPVAFATVQSIIERRCVTCHSSIPTDSVWRLPPNGVVFDSPQQIQAHLVSIKTRVVINRSMPLNNQTGITEAERAAIGDWIDQGAPMR